MSDLLDRFFGDFGWPTERGAWAPALDVAERDDAIIVRAELPGMKADDIDLQVQGNTLTIRGEKKESHEDKGENYHHVERRWGSFQRVIPLPESVDADHIDAKYADGVLQVTLPKTERAKPRKITVK
ncbi:MAG TPA: Hsp20/alpha crystallin family protein [Phycisphaerae bacterium]|nr:Hsp20/alpha crystallin family protein [Phycisphaerae bacterium]